MRVWFFACVLAIAAGCNRGAPNRNIVPMRTQVYMVVPSGGAEWVRAVCDGFESEAKKQNADAKIGTFDKEDAKSIVGAVEALNPGSTMTVCVLFSERDAIAETAQTLVSKDIRLITVGSDDSTAARVGHVGSLPSDAAKRWDEIRRQAFPNAKSVLVVFSSPTFKRARLQGAIFGSTLKVNSQQIRESTNPIRYRFVDFDKVTAKDVSQVDVVIAIGDDALRTCIKLDAKALTAVDGSKYALDWARGGKGRFLIGINYREIGRKAFQLAYQKITMQTVEHSFLELPYSDSRETTLDQMAREMETGESIGSG